MLRVDRLPMTVHGTVGIRDSLLVTASRALVHMMHPLHTHTFAYRNIYVCINYMIPL